MPFSFYLISEHHIDMAALSIILAGLCVVLAIITIALVSKVKILKTGMFHLFHFIIPGIIRVSNDVIIFLSPDI